MYVCMYVCICMYVSMYDAFVWYLKIFYSKRHEERRLRPSSCVVYVCMCVCVCIYIYVCVCVCVFLACFEDLDSTDTVQES